MNKRESYNTTDLLNTFLGYSDYSNYFRSNNNNNNYPPHNIYLEDEKSKDIFIDVAVSGFTKDEISVVCEEDVLTISGSHSDSSPMKRELIFTKRGISSKDFTLAWTVSPKYEVKKATMDNGILTVKLSYLNKDSIKKIEVV